MMKPDYSSISKDFNYYFGRQWRFKEFSPAQTDLRELEYRHLRSYSHAFNDDCSYTDLYETKDNTKVLRLQVSVPTFDADDRVSNSWRCLYLFPGEKWAGTDESMPRGDTSWLLPSKSIIWPHFPKNWKSWSWRLPHVPVSQKRFLNTGKSPPKSPGNARQTRTCPPSLS